MITARVSGSAAIERRLKALSDEIERQSSIGVREGAMLVEAKAKRLVLSKPKTGRIYALPSGVKHQASAPGEAPANRFGFLASSIVNWTLRMAPRPFLRRALRENAKTIRKIILDRINAAVAATKR
jgi:hypothetical protein